MRIVKREKESRFTFTMRGSLLCYRLPGVCCMIVIGGLAYLSAHLFYRNAVIKQESVKLYVELDRCAWEYSHAMSVKDEEIKLATEKYSTHWEQFSTWLRRRKDRKKIHRNAAFESQQIPNCQNCRLYDRSGEDGVAYDCPVLRINPETQICIYRDEEDSQVSGSIRQMGIWQENRVRDFQRWLERDSNLGFIDVGCYIGVYSLAAAAMGRSVLALDPSLENVKRLDRSLKLAQFDAAVTVLNNAVSDVRGRAEVIIHNFNRMATEVRQLNDSSAKGSDILSGEVTDTILLNDLSAIWQFKKALLRVDLNGFEHRAFSNADILFQNAFIPVVLMEWEAMKGFYWLPMTSRNRMLVESMIKFFLEMDYTPVSWDRRVLYVYIWDTWPSDILWVHKTFQF
ncbi:hypothetical protein LSH36_1g18013 [Paralvinella palmiformis]|uniref:Methyltransferase FkbM domain-containing protein n=1 Tax=Paralvinella palmiformis TaxID=53620 RepID=A0AAD9KGI5_9ANNE|nr:hypothetical protein LSH36_1g18013 [Paralvinella palmiformis]